MRSDLGLSTSHAEARSLTPIADMSLDPESCELSKPRKPQSILWRLARATDRCPRASASRGSAASTVKRSSSTALSSAFAATSQGPAGRWRRARCPTAPVVSQGGTVSRWQWLSSLGPRLWLCGTHVPLQGNVKWVCRQKAIVAGGPLGLDRAETDIAWQADVCRRAMLDPAQRLLDGTIEHQPSDAGRDPNIGPCVLHTNSAKPLSSYTAHFSNTLTPRCLTRARSTKRLH